jgi:homoserine O-acetyltransferase
VIGPGKAIDTDKLFVVSSNMLGSSYGSTNGASIDPRTGQPYGPDFPAITVRDIVAAGRALLNQLGVEHLIVVAGPSYGSYQAFQWAVAYPDLMDAIIPVVTAPTAQDAERGLAELQNLLAADPEWNGGRYYYRGGAKTVLTELRVEMLKRNGIEAALAPRYPDHAPREAEIRRQAVDWAQRWDTNSLVILRRGTIGYDTVKDFAKIKARVLYVLCRTDRIFPQSIAMGSCKLSPSPASRPATSRSTAISDTPRAVPNTPNGPRLCVISWRRCWQS